MEKNYSKINGNEVFGAPPDSGSGEGPNTSETSHATASVSYLSHNRKFIIWFVKFVAVFTLVSILFSIPLVVFRDIENFPEGATDDELKDRLGALYIYNVFTFLLISWVGIAVFYLLGTALPYIFRFVAR